MTTDYCGPDAAGSRPDAGHDRCPVWYVDAQGRERVCGCENHQEERP